jgi:hypothetical protein
MVLVRILLVLATNNKSYCYAQVMSEEAGARTIYHMIT